jgi:peptidoglycan/LPS O-acetylase OafA/YrhL
MIAAPFIPSRNNAVGALRLLLASLVIFTHAHLLGGFTPEWLIGWSRGTISAGTVGVQGFFVLSGWLLAASWRRQPTLGRFLWARALRLAPALWLCLLVTALLFTPLLWWHTPGARQNFFSLDPSPVGYVVRNLILPRTQISIGPFPNWSPWGCDWNGSLWTLFFEGACYLMLAAFGLAGLLTRWRVAGTVAIGGLLAVHGLWAIAHPSWLPAIIGRVFNTPGKLLTLHFLAGAVWAVWPEPAEYALRRPWPAVTAALALVALWHTAAHSWMSPWLLPPILLWAARHLPFADFEHRLGGDYSYGLYLYGYPLQQILAHFQVSRFGFATFLVASFALALTFAIASWHLVEKRALALKSVAASRRVANSTPA